MSITRFFESDSTLFYHSRSVKTRRIRTSSNRCACKLFAQTCFTNVLLTLRSTGDGVDRPPNVSLQARRCGVYRSRRATARDGVLENNLVQGRAAASPARHCWAGGKWTTGLRSLTLTGALTGFSRRGPRVWSLHVRFSLSACGYAVLIAIRFALVACQCGR